MPRAEKLAKAAPTLEGNLLSRWREHLRMSREDVGSQMSPPRDRGQIGEYENGVTRPSIGVLVQIVVALGVPGQTDEERLARFFAGPDSAPPIAPERLESLVEMVAQLRGGLDRQALILPLIGNAKLTVLDLEVTRGSRPVLVGAGTRPGGAAGAAPAFAAPTLPRRTGGRRSCWSAPE